jgi:hypothetical protein
MRRSNRRSSRIVFPLLLAVLVSQNLFVFAEKDPRRPACTTSACRQTKVFVKKHYCGESPFGNGPDDGCDIPQKKPGSGVRVVADFRCEWNEKKNSSECQQKGHVPPQISALLHEELQRLGLRKIDDKNMHFRVWTSTDSDWTLADADYARVEATNLFVCQVITIVDRQAKSHVLRRVRYQKTNVDVPANDSWSLIDIADVNGDGKPEIILLGNAYEDHWFEVVSVGEDWKFTTIFKGLGYYL